MSEPTTYTHEQMIEALALSLNYQPSIFANTDEWDTTIAGGELCAYALWSAEHGVWGEALRNLVGGSLCRNWKGDDAPPLSLDLARAWVDRLGGGLDLSKPYIYYQFTSGIGVALYEAGWSLHHVGREAEGPCIAQGLFSPTGTLRFATLLWALTDAALNQPRTEEDA